MTNNFTFNTLFIYSEKNNKFFYKEFSKGINLIYGPNTSGKSSLVQSLIYTFGINDGKDHLDELLALDLFFRLDGTVIINDKLEQIILIREGGNLFVKIGDKPVQTFNGINGNNSFEHKKLKHFFHKLFDFDLFLESKDEYKEAPIEAIFLPYYISQSVGWVYLRKSFSSLDYYRNFKDDYLDYYLGIETAIDRLAKKKLEENVLKIQREQNFLVEIENDYSPMQVSKIIDENFTGRSLEYLEEFKLLQEAVTQNEKEYLFKSNELSFLTERKSVVFRIKSNLNKQHPQKDNCPTCSQLLPFNLQINYVHKQEFNDTQLQYEIIKSKIILVQSEVNSLKLKIENFKEKINTKYQIFKNYSDQKISVETWLDTKANIRLNENVLRRLGQLVMDLQETKKNLATYKTEEEVLQERNKKSNTFKETFTKYLNELKVKELKDDRFTSLYKISAFPFQGVELHKTIMAYHFALNFLIKNTPNIHRLPFILDAVFKEDLDNYNEDLIIEFIAKNKPMDTQVFMTISEKTTKESQVKRYKQSYLDKDDKLIQIGNGQDTRTLLGDYNGQHHKLLHETLNIMNGM